MKAHISPTKSSKLQANLTCKRFINLQPITFIRKFNKMVDEQKKYPLKQKQHELKIIQFNKFPQYKFYQQMHAIYQIGTKQNGNHKKKNINKQDLYDELFLEKHRAFMTKSIQNIIKQTHERQNRTINLMKNSQQYPIKHKSNNKKYTQRKLSPLSLKLKKKYQDKSQHSTHNNTSQPHFKLPKQPFNTIEHHQQTYLQKIRNQRILSLNQPFNSKYRLKNHQEINQYLQKKKSTHSIDKIPSDQSLNSKPFQFNNPTHSLNLKNQFINAIITLQKEQSQFQQSYGNKIQLQINKCQQKTKQIIQKNKKLKFW